MHFGQIFKIFFVLCFSVFSAGAQTLDDIQNNPNIKSAEEILALAHNEKPTTCAAQLFSTALFEHADEIKESDPEFKVRAWARETMTGYKEILEQILDCPELQNIADDTTIIFDPIVYEFPMGRTITINYSTQPKVLKQKLMLANKRSLPNGDANPKLMDPNDPAKYMNTEPAWYAIMVVQHDSLKNFVGPEKNNTLSMKYLDEHIKEIYPKGYWCTSRSAWANDDDTINQVVRKVVDLEKDTNDYYVAGDINLEWVMYAEIAADVILSLATMGTGTALMGTAKSARAFKGMKGVIKSMNKLEKITDVQDYVKITKQISQHSDDIAKLEKEIKSLKNADEIADKRKQIQELKKTVQESQKKADKLADANKDVKEYKEQYEVYKDLHKYIKDLHGFKKPQTGNIVTRNLKKVGSYIKSVKAAKSGADTLKKASKITRAGMSSRSAKFKYWLTDTGLKHGARLGKYENKLGQLYGALTLIQILGDMYDKTSTTSKEFSNGIEFKPFCLLSADDLKGQENAVNYGMWLMWTGNSADSADDDAAYLQAMDFASKFYYELDEHQDEFGANCNVDIYVVSPFIRLDETDVSDPKGELFWLFMNEIPWSTADQFGAQVSNIEDWERVQTKSEQEDPRYKYHKKEDENSEQQKNE